MTQSNTLPFLLFLSPVIFNSILLPIFYLLALMNVKLSAEYVAIPLRLPPSRCPRDTHTVPPPWRPPWPPPLGRPASVLSGSCPPSSLGPCPSCLLFPLPRRPLSGAAGIVPPGSVYCASLVSGLVSCRAFAGPVSVQARQTPSNLSSPDSIPLCWLIRITDNGN